jgi:Domain of unknown function (DUF5916)
MRPIFFTPFCVILFLTFPALAQDTGYLNRPPIHIQKLQGAIVLDGLSDEPAWQQITPFPFIMLEPVYKGPPSYKTELLVTYDAQFIYVAARCYDGEPQKIVARNFLRDGWRGDDWVTFHIDAAGDKQNAVVFSVYPRGSKFDMSTANDGIETGGNTYNSYFNMIWEAKSVINEKGWFLEMKIPFSILRFRMKDGKAVMGISSTRAIMRKGEYYQFPAAPQNAYDPIMQPSLKQPVVFEDFKAGSFYNITPSLITNWEQNQHLDGSGQKYISTSKLKPNASLDVKYGISPTLTLDATVNTDFAQAEADRQQFNLSRFSIFFPERRLFFQEQAGYYDFNSGSTTQLFYSRTIGLKDGAIIPVAGGLRLTGKAGPWDVGLLNMQTQSGNVGDTLHVPTENFGVVRLRRKAFNSHSYFGGIFTSRFNNQTHNFAGGLDALIRVKGDQYLTAAVAKTVDKGYFSYKNLTASGMMHLVYELRRTDRFFYKAGYNYIGNDYNPAAGFVARKNFHELFGNIFYGKFPKDQSALFKYMKFNAGADAYWSATSSKLESWNGYGGGRVTTFKGHEYQVFLNHYYEKLVDSLPFSDVLSVPPGGYHFGDIWMIYNSPPNLNIKKEITLITGPFYDGWRYSGNLSAVFNINKFVELESGYKIEYLRFKKRNLEEAIHIARLRLNVATNLHFSGSIEAQYNSAIDHTLVNGRMRYNFRDGHDIYIVYNEVLNNNRVNYLPKLPVINEQQVLIKYVYTFY